MLKNWVLFTLLIISLAGCSKKEKSSIQSYDLTGVEIKIDEILDPHMIYSYDSILLIKEKNRGEKSIVLLNLNDEYRFIHRVCRLGRGPGEITNPASIVFDSESNNLWYPDWSKYKIFKFPIDSILTNEDYLPKKFIPINKGMIPMGSVFYHPSGNFGFTSYNYMYNLINFIDTTGKINNNLTVKNKISQELWDGLNFADNPYSIEYNSKIHKYFLASKKNNYVAYLDEDGNILSKITEFSFIDNPGSSDERQRDTFYDIVSNDSLIFCLYSDKVFMELVSGQNEMKINYPTRVIVFDWSGDIKYNLSLDHPIIVCALDKINNRIIGLSDDFENRLVMFDISKFK